MTTRRELLKMLSAVPAMLVGSRALANAFPTRPIRIIVGFPPGGSSDTVVRLLAEKLQARLGVTVMVENKPGATGTIAVRQVARSEPDGYTLAYGTSSTHAIAPLFDPAIGYDPIKDFTPLTLINRSPMVIVANPTVPANTIPELVELAKTRADEPLTYASPGEMSSQNLAMKIVADKVGIRLQHVPYRGSSPALIDLLGGRVDLMIDNIPVLLNYLQAGKIRPLAVSSQDSAPQLPEIPPLSRYGIDIDIRSWGGVVGPVNLPADVAQRLSTEMAAALASADLREAIFNAGSTPQGGDAESFAKFILRERNGWLAAQQRGVI